MTSVLLCPLIFLLFVQLQRTFSEDCQCSRIFKPICGTDSQTYENECILNCFQKQRKDLKVDYSGACCPHVQLCAAYSDPVCDDKGVTHENECIFEFYKCIQRKRSGLQLGLASKGKCDVASSSPPRTTQNSSTQMIKFEASGPLGRRQCDFFCDEIAQPICDTKGVTHKNFCKFDLTNCRILSRGLPALQISHAGRCEGTQGSEEEQSDLQSPHRKRWFFSNHQQEGLPLISQSSTPSKWPNTKKPVSEDLVFKKSAMENEKIVDKQISAVKQFFAGVAEANNGSGTEEAPAVSTTTTLKPSRSIAEVKLEEDLEVFGADNDTKSQWQAGSARFISEKPRLFPGVVNAASSFVGGATGGEAASVPVVLPDALVDNYGLDKTEVAPEYCLAENCDKVWDPLCDTQNTTHKNECLFRFHVCKLEKANEVNATSASDISETGWTGTTTVTTRTIQPLKIAYYGKCGKYARRRESDIQPQSICKLCEQEEEDEKDVLPICDNANQTHQSICLFAEWNCEHKLREQEQRVLVHIGACHIGSPVFQLSQEECPHKCSKQYKPVCDTNGLSHPNLCTFQMFNCHHRRMNKTDNAGWLKSLRACGDTVLNRVDSTTKGTATNSQTPPTTLASSPARLTTTTTIVLATNAAAGGGGDAIAECLERKCEEKDTSQEKRKICDSEGNFHQSECMFAKAHCLAAREGKTLRIVENDECESSLPVPKTSTFSEECREFSNCSSSAKDYDAYCGSDFHTYPNYCSFKQEQCNHNKKLEIIFKGECQLCLNKPCPIIEPEKEKDDSLFICDQSGETKSKCEFEMLRCIYEIKFGYNITEAYVGKCCKGSEECLALAPSSSQQEQTVCDTNGKIYRNRCFYEVAACRATKITHSKLEETACSQNILKVEYNQTDDSSQARVVLDFRITDAPVVEKKPLKFNELQALSTSTQTTSIMCSDKYEPICSLPGPTTYKNICHFEQQQSSNINKTGAETKILYNGECCSNPPECSTEYSPVCDSQGNTHLNLCEFGRNRCITEKTTAIILTLVDYKACKQLQCTTDCPAIYKPICGSNGKTYANKCDLERSICILKSSGNLKMDYEGECCRKNECDLNFQPICDNLGRTHINECFFKNEACVALHRNNVKLWIGYKGECCDASSCSQEFRPVCDGKETHLNMCHFRAKQCEADRRGELLRLVYSGECCVFPQGECEQSSPLCDSDGVTHKNRCFFEFKRCNAHKIQQKSINVVHEGDCCKLEDCPRQSTGEADAVCDTKGVSHSSLCDFKNTKCIFEKVNPNSTLTVDYMGRCCANVCDEVHEPVCDQHGNTYQNNCQFLFKSCVTTKKSASPLIITLCTTKKTQRILRRHLSPNKIS